MFPFTLYCDRERGWSNVNFRPLFLSNKPKELIWYAYDVNILSKSEVEFIVYDIKDAVYGGVGSKLLSFICSADENLVKEFVVDRATSMAIVKRKQELNKEEDFIVAGYTNSILDSIY